MGQRRPDPRLARRAFRTRGVGGSAPRRRCPPGVGPRVGRPYRSGLRRRRVRRPRRDRLFRREQDRPALAGPARRRKSSSNHPELWQGRLAGRFARWSMDRLCPRRRRSNGPAGHRRCRRPCLAAGVGQRSRFLHAAPLESRWPVPGLRCLGSSPDALGRQHAVHGPGLAERRWFASTRGAESHCRWSDDRRPAAAVHARRSLPALHHRPDGLGADRRPGDAWSGQALADPGWRRVRGASLGSGNVYLWGQSRQPLAHRGAVRSGVLAGRADRTAQSAQWRERRDDRHGVGSRLGGLHRRFATGRVAWRGSRGADRQRGHRAAAGGRAQFRRRDHAHRGSGLRRKRSRRGPGPL